MAIAPYTTGGGTGGAEASTELALVPGNLNQALFAKLAQEIIRRANQPPPELPPALAPQYCAELIATLTERDREINVEIAKVFRAQVHDLAGQLGGIRKKISELDGECRKLDEALGKLADAVAEAALDVEGSAFEKLQARYDLFIERTNKHKGAITIAFDQFIAMEKGYKDFGHPALLAIVKDMFEARATALTQASATLEILIKSDETSHEHFLAEKQVFLAEQEAHFRFAIEAQKLTGEQWQMQFDAVYKAAELRMENEKALREDALKAVAEKHSHERAVIEEEHKVAIEMENLRFERAKSEAAHKTKMAEIQAQHEEQLRKIEADTALERHRADASAETERQRIEAMKATEFAKAETERRRIEATGATERAKEETERRRIAATKAVEMAKVFKPECLIM